MLQHIAMSCGGYELHAWSGQEASELYWLAGTALPPPTQRWHEDAGLHIVAFVLPLLPTCSRTHRIPQPCFHALAVDVTVREGVSVHMVEALCHASEEPIGTMTKTLFVQVQDRYAALMHACFAWIRFKQRQPAYRSVRVQSLLDGTTSTLYKCTPEQNRQMQHALSLSEHRPWLVPIPLFLCTPTCMICADSLLVHVDADAHADVQHECLCLQLNAFKCNRDLAAPLLNTWPGRQR